MGAHIVGCSIQSMGPLDGNGLVIHGLAADCGKCRSRFMVQMEKIVNLGASIFDISSFKQKLFCPYCGHEASCQPSSLRLTDTRPMGGD